MAKQAWKPGNMIYPVPAVIVSVGKRSGETNLFTVGWTGNICTNPPMVYISVRPERYSYEFIEDSGEFVINLTTEKLAPAADFCGVRSGRDINKWEKCSLTPEKAGKLEFAPLIKESPVNIECRVREFMDLGSHRMYIADVLQVNVDESCMDESGRADLNKPGLICYSHGDYMSLGKKLGSFGYSVKKKTAAEKRKKPAGRQAKPSGRTGKHGAGKQTEPAGRPEKNKRDRS